jgi:hypothetical protein
MKTSLHLYDQIENQIQADFHNGRIDFQTAIRELVVERNNIDWNSILPLDFYGEGIA